MASTNFLTRVPKLSHHDLKGSLNDIEIETLDEFEVAWLDFLRRNPKILPTGKKGERIRKLEKQLHALQTSKKNVQAELQRQLDFFSQSRDQMEANYEKAMESASASQKKLVHDMNLKIDNVALAGHILPKTLPWEYFYDTLDRAVARDGIQPLPETTGPKGAKQLKPSARAMLLVNANRHVDARASDFMLRAYRIDNCLMSAQLKLLQREIERHERTTDSLEFVGKFMTEQNIWGLWTKSSSLSRNDSTQGSSTQASTAASSTQSSKSNL